MALAFALILLVLAAASALTAMLARGVASGAGHTTATIWLAASIVAMLVAAIVAVRRTIALWRGLLRKKRG